MERVVIQVAVRHGHPEHRAEYHLALPDRVRRAPAFLQRRDVVARHRPVGLGQPQPPRNGITCSRSVSA